MRSNVFLFFNGKLNFTAQTVARCVYKREEIKSGYKHVNEEYHTVFPKEYVDYEQADLFNLEEKTFYGTYVVFDLETTGLEPTKDEIIEIGAVKIENGKITQRFMSYVDPEKPIPPESSAISGIIDSDVAGAPKDYEILQDFYKFTRGAILIGYNNINFDNVFLIGQGKECRWDFASNETDDVYRYAQKYVHGVKNYRLGTIAAALGVTLDNAHRAVFDALATAEVFIKIAKMIK